MNCKPRYYATGKHFNAKKSQLLIFRNKDKLNREKKQLSLRFTSNFNNNKSLKSIYSHSRYDEVDSRKIVIQYYILGVVLVQACAEYKYSSELKLRNTELTNYSVEFIIAVKASLIVTLWNHYGVNFILSFAALSPLF